MATSRLMTLVTSADAAGLLEASAAIGFEEPDLNSYAISLRIPGIRKADALKIAKAIRSVLDHEGHVGAAIDVAHLKFEG